MLELKELIEERDSIMLTTLAGGKVDFSKLRDICKRFNETCVVEKVFECDGTDQQLWESVNTYFKKLLKLS